jgi:hypothetical protein
VKLKCYRLGLGLVPELPPARRPRPINGAGWKIGFQFRPSVPNTPETRRFFREGLPGYDEVVVLAPNIHTASRAATLVHAARAVFEGSLFSYLPIDGLDPLLPYPLDGPGEVEEAFGAAVANALEQHKDTMIKTDTVLPGCLLAGALSRSKAGQYATLKLFDSMQRVSIHLMDLHPDYGRIVLPQSRTPTDHVRWAQAIVQAYGAIEELGLGIPAGPGKSAMVEDEYQRLNWNPNVLTPLLDRLQKRHVNVDERLIWNVRGPRRTVAAKAIARLLEPTKASWARGPIQDVSANITDAINAVSFLRSKAAAHGGQELRAKLSPVDVHNCGSPPGLMGEKTHVR